MRRIVDIARFWLAGSLIAAAAIVFWPVWQLFAESARFYRPLLVVPAYPGTFTLLLSFAMVLSGVSLLLRVAKSIGIGLFTGWSFCAFISGLALWIGLESGHAVTAIVSSLVGIALSALLSRKMTVAASTASTRFYSDRPLEEGGKDLLNRGRLVTEVVSTIITDKPSVIAITGDYGSGKTSFIHLVTGELKKFDPPQRPITVHFNPWLPSDPTALAHALLRSVVSAIEEEYFIPGLGENARLYAKTIASALPSGKDLAALFEDPPQAQKLDLLTRQISSLPRRIVIVLDDLDRMQAQELETVLKMLKGAPELKTVTFLCALDKVEVAKILRSLRRYQSTERYLEKFFTLEIPLPPIDRAELRKTFVDRVTTLIRNTELEELLPSDFSSQLDETWKHTTLIRNIRGLNLLLNRLAYVLPIIGREVYLPDLVRLELVRSLNWNWYQKVFERANYFFSTGMAIETWDQTVSIDDKEAKRRRNDFYEELKTRYPENSEQILTLLSTMFPYVQEYQRERGVWLHEYSSTPGRSDEAEQNRRIFHPRFFRQYFIFGVPKELYSQEELQDFISSIKSKRKEEVASSFSEEFQKLEMEEFKRWRFVHLVCEAAAKLQLEVAEGLCLGMARNASAFNQYDAFELADAVVCIMQTANRLGIQAEEFLRAVVDESSSPVLIFAFLHQAQASDAPYPIRPEHLAMVRERLARKMHVRYLETGHSVYRDFPSGIEPHRVLFDWQRLSDKSKEDQRRYLINELSTNITSLRRFISMLFRVQFIDDYSTLKALIDYDKLESIIDANLEALSDETNVTKFKERHAKETGAAN